jgi:di/tricarboxylate transporter
MDEAYRAIDWKAVFLIACMLPLGTAMETTGTARLLADQVVNLTGGYSSLIVLGTLFVMTALLTEVISNAAATVLLVPIAIDIALGLNLNPQPFIMTAVIAASTSFLMPIGHQVNVIIYGAGGYKFSDYTRVGVWLNLLLLITTILIVPLIWPLTG